MTLPPPPERPDPELPPPPPAVAPGGVGEKGKVSPTRLSAAWVGVCAGVVAVILLIIFIGQNTAAVRINFLWMDGSIPTALALLIAGVGGAIIAIAVGAARIIQLRRLVRRQ